MSKRSAIEIQINARVRAPRNGRAITKELIHQAIQYRVTHGENPAGIDLHIVRWRHSANDRWTRGRASNWDEFARFLPAASFIVGQIKSVRSR